MYLSVRVTTFSLKKDAFLFEIEFNDLLIVTKFIHPYAQYSEHGGLMGELTMQYLVFNI